MSEKKIRIGRPKYKKAKYINEQGRHRANEILKCKKCKGNPDVEDFNLKDFKGERCADKDCMQVINYQAK